MLANSQTPAYSFSLVFRHPTWPLSKIVEALWISAPIAWSVGEPHPEWGAAKAREFSYWCFSIRSRTNPSFFAELEELCRWLQPMRLFAEEFRASGGSIHADIGLRGSVNIGWSLSPRTCSASERSGDYFGHRSVSGTE